MNTFFQARPSSSVNVHEEIPQPWIEKYRPKSMESISAQEQTVAVLKKTIESQNLPHMLFYGPPGTGKTSTILALARELYGPKLMKTRILELNASDERGIQVIRDKVKNFARTAVSNRRDSDYPCPPYKIVILDEADLMTQDAQSALRRVIETYSKVTRFCLICNYVTRIIEPLASRCAKFRFKPLDISNTTSRLKMICEQEAVNYSPQTLEELAKLSEGDLRKAIMYLQSASKLHKKEMITSESIREIAGVVSDDLINSLVESAKSNKDETQLEEAVTKVIDSGFSAIQILSQVQDRILDDFQFNEAQKARIGEFIGQFDKYLADGTDEHLVILNLIKVISDTNE
ncbi:P-loop containing nucleoside triphosphate hydrolase protein [Gigaspora rosea]|uniref:P-loop containing nucleoside triphosphate hydrolase protein n=1 Tax=Gigaspora rosea TaxID=44941 RepID=A0A397VLI8_9GLOM|nr:P-loop containing nucleoside triphosphate hydrolase protein [Gigaspora rosea]